MSLVIPLVGCQPSDAVTPTCDDPDYEYDWFNGCVLKTEVTASSDDSLHPGVSTSQVSCGNNNGACFCFDDNGNQIDPVPEICSVVMSTLPPANGNPTPGLEGSYSNLGGGAAGAGSDEDSLKAYCEAVGQDDPSCWSYYYPEGNDAAD